MALDAKRRRFTWRDWSPWGAFIVLYYVVFRGLPRVLPPEWRPWIELAGVVAFGALVLWTIGMSARNFVRDRRTRRTVQAKHADGRWPLGESYAVEVDPWCNGGRIWHTMRIDERGVRFRPRGPLSRGWEFDGVDVVHVHASWIEIISGDESVRVVPRSYADRERMLWELAFRWSAAVDRGIDETPQAVPHPVAIPSATTAAVDVPHPVASGLGLASALAGPMDRGNPAPPRKSGLGNGLFVAPTDDK